MKSMKKTIFGILLYVCIMIGLLLGRRLTAWAKTETYTALIPTNTDNAMVLSSKMVSFNGCTWYIIEDNSTAVDAGTITLLAADTSFGVSVFSTNNSNNYSTSTLKAAIDKTVTSGSFKSVAEAIKDTDNGKLYLLSFEEAWLLPESVRQIDFIGTTTADGSWWLRSTGSRDGEPKGRLVQLVRGSDGHVEPGGTYANEVYGVRPALKLNLSSVIFSSESKTFSLKHSVTLSGGANAATSGGATSQTGLTGAMTTVTYTANTGYYFAEFADIIDNGITATRTSSTVVTVAGTPTADANITVPDAAAIPTYEVTYKVANGTWSDGSTTDRKETVQSGSKPASVPTGMKASEGYTGGAWDTDPASATITGAKTFTYTFTAKQAATVTKAPEAKTLTCTGSAQELVTAGTASGGTMQYALGENATTAPADNLYTTSIPAKTDAGTYYVWYKAKGDGNHKDSAAAFVTTKIRAQISAVVTFKVVNGTWDDGSTKDKTVTLKGYEGDTLKLVASQIPAVGNKPNENFKAGSWNTTPNTSTVITSNTTYTYTYKEAPTSTPPETEVPTPTPPETEAPTPTQPETEAPAPTPQETEAPAPTQPSTETTVQEPITIPKTPASAKTKVKKNKVTVTWKNIKKTKKTRKLIGKIKFIQIQYSTDKAFRKNAVKKKVGKNKTKATYTLKKNTTYYIRIRYVGKDGVSKWTKAKKVKTKK